MTENAFWIARFPHGSLPADISVSIPLQNGHKRATGFMMPGEAAVGPGVCQDLGDSLRLTALTEDLKLRFDRSYKIPFFFRTDADPQFGSRARCSVLSRDSGYLARTFESRQQTSAGGIRSQNDYRAGLVRLDPAGEVMWARALDYSANGVTMFQVLPVNSGGVLITLSFESKGARTFVAFVDDMGALKWAKVFDRRNVTLLPILESAERFKLDTLLVSAMEVRRAPTPAIRSLVMALDFETGDILHQAVLPKRFNMAAFGLRDWDGALLLTMMGVDMMSRKFHAGVAKVSGSLEPLAGLSIVDAEAIFPVPQPLVGDRNLISYSFLAKKHFNATTSGPKLDPLVKPCSWMKPLELEFDPGNCEAVNAKATFRAVDVVATDLQAELSRGPALQLAPLKLVVKRPNAP